MTEETKTPWRKITYQQMRDIAQEMTLLHNKLMELGLVKTYHAMHEAVKALGWENSEIISGNHPTKLDESK